MKVLLYRQVHGLWRYYELSIQKNLFQEYSLHIRFGSCVNKSKHYKYYNFQSFHEALISLKKHMKQKVKKGYQANIIDKNSNEKEGEIIDVAA